MLRSFCASLLGLGLCCASASELEIIDGSTSPNRTFAIGYDYLPARHQEGIWRVTLPGKKPIGEPYTCEGFIGLRYHGGAVWNSKASLVAVVQGGIPLAETKVFHYSRQGLQELALPDLRELPAAWYPQLHVGRVYIIARHWKSRNRLAIEISGTLTSGENPQRFSDYQLEAIVAFGSRGKSKVVHVADQPVKEI